MNYYAWAVISKLGHHIERDYSTDLLSIFRTKKAAETLCQTLNQRERKLFPDHPSLYKVQKVTFNYASY